MRYLLACLLVALFASLAEAQEVVEFTRPDCVYCDQMEPILRKLKASGFPIRKVGQEYSVGRGITGFPTFIAYGADGRETQRIAGAVSEATLRGMLSGWKPAAPPGARVELPSELASSVVRIRNIGTVGNVGSGTIVEHGDSYSVVLSCAHLVAEGTGQLQVVFADGRAWQAELIGVDNKRDLSAFVTNRLPARAIPVATSPVKIGDLLWSSGYGAPGSGLATNRGKVTQFVTIPERGNQLAIEMAGGSRSGDSGGPIINERGELAGVLFGTNGEITNGTDCVECCRFLDGVRSRLQRRFGRTPVPPPQQSPQVSVPALPSPEPYRPQDEYRTYPANPPLVDLPKPPPIDLSGDLTAARAEAERLRKQLEDSGKDNGAATKAIGEQKSIIDGLQRRVDELQNRPPEINIPLPPLPEPIAKAAEGWLDAKILAGAAMVGVPAIPAVIGLWLAKRRLKKRLAARHAASDEGITPPQIQRDVLVRDKQSNHYVEVPIDKEGAAWAEAARTWANAYPGAVSTLTGVERLKNQILKGQPLQPRSES